MSVLTHHLKRRSLTTTIAIALDRIKSLRASDLTTSPCVANKRRWRWMTNAVVVAGVSAVCLTNAKKGENLQITAARDKTTSPCACAVQGPGVWAIAPAALPRPVTAPATEISVVLTKSFMGELRISLGLVDLSRIQCVIFFLEVHPGSEMASQDDCELNTNPSTPWLGKRPHRPKPKCPGR